jgi:hypothetical protein
MITIKRNKRNGFTFTNKNGIYLTTEKHYLMVDVDNSDIVKFNGYYNVKKMSESQKEKILKEIVNYLYS